MTHRSFFRTLLLFAVLLGIVIGLGSYTFFYAEGVSYFSENPNIWPKQETDGTIL